MEFCLIYLWESSFGLNYYIYSIMVYIISKDGLAHKLAYYQFLLL